VLTWIMFQLGQVMHLAAQIDAIVRAKNNPAISRWIVFQERLIPILVRSFIATLGFMIVLGGGLPKIFGMFNATPPNWTVTVAVLLSDTGLVGYAIAGGLGFGADSVLGFVPMLKAYIPPPIDQETAVQNKGFAQGVDAAKQAVEEVKPPVPVEKTDN